MRATILVLLVLVLFSGGCQEQAKNQEASDQISSAMTVEIDGDGQFPEFLAGKWRSNEYGWEFVFKPDGSLESAVITLARVRVHPGKTTEIPMKAGGKGIFEPGPWFVGYSKEQKELSVEIVMKDLYLEMGKTALLGKSRDMFVGNVSEGGDRWDVEWMSYPDYIAKVPGEEDFPMREEEGYGVPHEIFFTKVADQ